MGHPFESLPTTPTADEVVDQAFSRAARAGRAKGGVEAQQSMLQTATTVLADNLRNVATTWPDFDALDPFYYELADAIAGVDELRQHISAVSWAGRKVSEIRSEYQSRLAGDPETARKLRKQAFARLADVTREVDDDLRALNDARNHLKVLPDIRPDEPTIVVAGYPNVGKSSFVNHVTRASNPIAAYPFTTTQIHVGHVERDRIRYQLVDTPGLLDRPAVERNESESQAVSALEHAADVVLVIVDASGECGYPVDVQLALRDELADRFPAPVITVCNKADRSTDVEADHYMSVVDDDGVEAVLDAAIEAVDVDLELPFDE